MKKLIIAISLLALSSHINAEPSTVVKYLMDEPLTMFEWGMLRTEESLSAINIIKTLKKEFNSMWGGIPKVTYDWDRNLLIINYKVSLLPTELKKESIKKICCEITTSTRLHFGYLPPSPIKGVELPKKHWVYEDSKISNNFKHKGFTTKDQPASLDDEIENITVIRVEVIKRKKTPGSGLSDILFRFTDTIAYSESPLKGEACLIHENENNRQQ